MGRSIHLRFASVLGPLRVAEFHSEMGLLFEGRRDATPLNAAISVRPVFPGALDAVRRQHGWRSDQFILDVAAADGALRLSGYQGYPENLPIGVYDLGVEVESYRFRDAWQRVVVNEDGEATANFVEKPDRRRVQLVDNMDRSGPSWF